MSTEKDRQYSSQLLDGPRKTPDRAMLRAVGFSDEDFHKSRVGIASTWGMVTRCNMHINELADIAGDGIDTAGGKSLQHGAFLV